MRPTWSLSEIGWEVVAVPAIQMTDAEQARRSFPTVTNMTHDKSRNADAATQMYFAVGKCSLGFVLVASRGHGICAILLGDDEDALKSELQERFPQAGATEGGPDAKALAATAIRGVETPARDLGVPLDVSGTAFQRRVWTALREIPVGKTASYSDIAARIGSPKSVRAVAQACAANALAVAIPCHRVVRRDGSLSGYRWGMERKRRLLDLEARA